MPICAHDLMHGHYYGQSVGSYAPGSAYTWAAFESILEEGGDNRYHPSGSWTTLHGGVCEGRLIGGYLMNYAFLLNTTFCPVDPTVPHILFLEEYHAFFQPAAVSRWLSHIEQSGLLRSVAGVLFGHYSEEPSPVFLQVLQRFADRWRLPFAKCDDFGHGANHAILPIGGRARLDAGNGTLNFLE